MGIEIEKRLTASGVLVRVAGDDDDKEGVLNPLLFGGTNLISKTVSAGLFAFPSEVVIDSDGNVTSGDSRFYSKGMDGELKVNLYARVARKMRGILNFTSATPATTTTNIRNVEALWSYVVGVTAMYARYIHFMSMIHLYDMEVHDLGELRAAVRAAAPWVDLSNSQYSNVREVLVEIAAEFQHLHFPPGLVDDMKWLFSARKLTPREQAAFAFFEPETLAWTTEFPLQGIRDPFKLLEVVQKWRRDITVMELDRRMEEAMVAWNIGPDAYIPLPPGFDVEWYELWMNQGVIHNSRFALNNSWMWPSASMPNSGAKRIPWFTLTGSITQRQLRYWAHRTTFSGKSLDYPYSGRVLKNLGGSSLVHIGGYSDAIPGTGSSEQGGNVQLAVASTGFASVGKISLLDDKPSSKVVWMYYDPHTQRVSSQWDETAPQAGTGTFPNADTGKRMALATVRGPGVLFGDDGIPTTYEEDVACQFMANIRHILRNAETSRYAWEAKTAASGSEYRVSSQGEWLEGVTSNTAPGASTHKFSAVQAEQLSVSVSAYVALDPSADPTWTNIQDHVLDWFSHEEALQARAALRGNCVGYGLMERSMDSGQPWPQPITPFDGSLMLVTQERVRQNVYDTFTYLLEAGT